MKKIWIMRIIFSFILYIFNGVNITKKSIQSRITLKKESSYKLRISQLNSLDVPGLITLSITIYNNIIIFLAPKQKRGKQRKVTWRT